MCLHRVWFGLFLLDRYHIYVWAVVNYLWEGNPGPNNVFCTDWTMWPLTKVTQLSTCNPLSLYKSTHLRLTAINLFFHNQFMMSGWATTFTWRCDLIDTSSSPQALRVSCSRPSKHSRFLFLVEGPVCLEVMYQQAQDQKLMNLSFVLSDDSSGLDVLFFKIHWTPRHGKAVLHF